MKKRIIAIAVAVCLLFSLHLTADARGTLSSEYIDSIMVSVQALGDSSMNVRVVIFANAQMSEIGVSSLVVEESKSSNGPWSIKKSTKKVLTNLLVTSHLLEPQVIITEQVWWATQNNHLLKGINLPQIPI